MACSAWQPPHEDSLLPFHASSGSTQVENSHRLYRTSSSTWHQTTYSRHRSGAIRLTSVLALRVTLTTRTAFHQIRTYLDWSLYRLLLVLPSLGTRFTKSTRNQQIIFRVGDKAAPVLSFFSSLASLTSLMMDFVLTYLAPPGLVSLVATQVVWSKVLKNF